VIPRRWFRASLVAALAMLGAAAGLSQPLPPGVDDCLAAIERLRTATKSAATEPDARERSAPVLGDVCPDVAAALDASPWGEALAGVSARELEPSAFVDLTKLVASYERPAAAGAVPAPSAAVLDDVLAGLKLEKPTTELTLWERIQRWYDEHFGASSDEARGWLETWLRRFAPSDAWVGYFVIVLGIALVGGTVAIIVNELRVAGVLAGGVLRKYSPLSSSTSEPEQPRARDLDDVMRAPLRRRPALLLALVLERLRSRGALPLRDSLTHRELLRAAHLSAEQRAAFGAVVGAAERVTFADWQPTERDVDPLLARGRELLSSLPVEAATK
jgi:hypothetical protein